MEKFVPKSENIYNIETAKRYYEVVGAGEYKTDADKFLESLIPENLDDKFVLDHGCGNGRYGELFLRKGASSVLGIDLSPEMLRKAEQLKKEKNLKNLNFVLGDINNLPIGKDKFDFIFSRFSLVYSPNIVQVIKEMSDSLSEKGEILVETNVASIKNREEEIENHFIPLILKLENDSVPIKNYPLTMDRYLDAFEKAGLEVLIQKEFPANEITINDSYKYKDLVSFEAFIFKLTKKKINP